MIRIRLAEARDAEALPAIERSAGEANRRIPDLAWVAETADHSAERYGEMIGQGVSRVAVDAPDQLVAFLCAEIFGTELHIWELSVRLERQRAGIGRALLDRMTSEARDRGLAAVTLTTFRDITWNEPWYRRRGFRTFDVAEVEPRLAAVLRDEVARGLPLKRRCAMRLALR